MRPLSSFALFCKLLKRHHLNKRLEIAHFAQASRFYGIQSETFAVTYKEHGDPNKVLEGNVLQLPKTIGPGEVYVRMLAAPVNPADINTIEGTYPTKPTLPTIVGNEGVGEILDVGPDVKSLKPGEWVIPNSPGWGTWREYAICPETEFRHIPKNIPVVSAATITVNPCTAYRMLTDFVDLKEGDTVIQNGANSAAGQAVIQIAAARNIETINIVRNRPEIDDLKTELNKLGATHVITEEFCRTPGMRELMKGVSKPKLALNCVGRKSATELIRQLDNQGVMVTYGGMSKQPIIVPTGVMIFKEIKLSGYWMTQWSVKNKDNPRRDEMFDDLCNLIREGKLVPAPHDLVPLKDFKMAVKGAMEGYSGKKQLLQIHN